MRSRIYSRHGGNYKKYLCKASLADCDKYFTKFGIKLAKKYKDWYYAACKVVNGRCEAADMSLWGPKDWGLERCDERVPLVSAEIKLDMIEGRKECSDYMCGIAMKGKWKTFGQKKAIEEPWPLSTGLGPFNKGWFNTAHGSKKCWHAIKTTYQGGRG